MLSGTLVCGRGHARKTFACQGSPESTPLHDGHLYSQRTSTSAKPANDRKTRAVRGVRWEHVWTLVFDFRTFEAFILAGCSQIFSEGLALSFSLHTPAVTNARSRCQLNRLRLLWWLFSTAMGVDNLLVRMGRKKRCVMLLVPVHR